MNKFKIGDKVYYPTESNKVFTLEGTGCTVSYPLRCGPRTFTKDGRYRVSDITPSLYHATPENKAKLEDFYGIPFEPAPSKPTSREIIKAMLARGDMYVCCWVSDHKQEPGYPCMYHLISDYDEDTAIFPYRTIRGDHWKYATPFNPRTGETITELPE